MKNYDELTNDLLERRDRYVAEQRRKRKAAVRIVIPICCACAIILLGIGLWNNHTSDLLPTVNNDKQAGINSITFNTERNNVEDNTSAQKNETEAKRDNAPIEIMWVINRVDGMLGGAMPDFAVIADYSEIKEMTYINQYLGYDVAKLTNVMPEGFQFVGNHEVEFYYKNDGNLIHDHCHFGYTKNEQEITISVSKIGAPYDCLYMMDNPTPTVINGVEIVIGAWYADENPDDYDLVFADFSCNGMYYRVTVSNLPTNGENGGMSCMINILSELTK